MRRLTRAGLPAQVRRAQRRAGGGRSRGRRARRPPDAAPAGAQGRDVRAGLFQRVRPPSALIHPALRGGERCRARAPGRYQLCAGGRVRAARGGHMGRGLRGGPHAGAALHGAPVGGPQLFVEAAGGAAGAPAAAPCRARAPACCRGRGRGEGRKWAARCCFGGSGRRLRARCERGRCTWRPRRWAWRRPCCCWRWASAGTACRRARRTGRRGSLLRCCAGRLRAGARAGPARVLSPDAVQGWGAPEPAQTFAHSRWRSSGQAGRRRRALYGARPCLARPEQPGALRQRG